MKNEEIKQIYESMLVEAEPSKKDILAGFDKIIADTKKEEEVKKQAVEAIDKISEALHAYEILLKNEGETIRKILLKIDKETEDGFFKTDLDQRFYYSVSGFSEDYAEFIRGLEIDFN